MSQFELKPNLGFGFQVFGKNKCVILMIKQL